MIKHVGRHNNQKVAILYKMVPNEEHMCLVVYSDMLPKLIHGEVMKVLESPVGQNEKEFSDALYRHVMSDGRNCLTVLHKEGFIKKVPTNQVIVTANAKSSIRLDELNAILKDMEKGQEAVDKLKSIDDSLGTGVTKTSAAQNSANNSKTDAVDGLLTDEQLAKNLLDQAEGLKKQIQMLTEEIKNLENQAQELNPSLKKSNARKKSKEPQTV